MAYLTATRGSLLVVADRLAPGTEMRVHSILRAHSEVGRDKAGEAVRIDSGDAPDQMQPGELSVVQQALEEHGQDHTYQPDEPVEQVDPAESHVRMTKALARLLEATTEERQPLARLEHLMFRLESVIRGRNRPHVSNESCKVLGAEHELEAREIVVSSDEGDYSWGIYQDPTEAADTQRRLQEMLEIVWRT